MYMNGATLPSAFHLSYLSASIEKTLQLMEVVVASPWLKKILQMMSSTLKESIRYKVLFLLKISVQKVV